MFTIYLHDNYDCIVICLHLIGSYFTYLLNFYHTFPGAFEPPLKAAYN